VSSAPSGIDVREYTYGNYALSLTAPGFYTLSARSNWLVTRVQFYTGANAGILILQQPFQIPVAANGCITLEPNGAHRGQVVANGNGALLIIEYWFQTFDGFPILVDEVTP